MFDPGSVRIRGPLRAHVEGFWSELRRGRYAPLSAASHLRLAAHFSGWLEDHGLGLSDLSEEAVASFLAHRRRQGYTLYLSPRGLWPLLEYLHGTGVVLRPASVVEIPTDRLLGSYAAYLARERSLCSSTIRAYVKLAQEFTATWVDGAALKWEQMTAAKVTSFVIEQARRLNVAYVKNKLTALRSFLRFLHVGGHIPSALAGFVPAIAGYRLASVPKALEPHEIDRLLRQVPEPSTKGRRETAIVRLMVRLGLRAGEVAALELDEIDWRAGELVVCGKGKRESRLPLPHDVGKTLVAYLRRRPRSRTRKVFLRSRAPYDGLSSGGVISVVRKALRRAGIGAGGAHLLRHSAATQMLRQGASLSEIAQVLRHRQVDTTAIYAKVDLASLEWVVQPWPGSAR